MNAKPSLTLKFTFALVLAAGSLAAAAGRAYAGGEWSCSEGRVVFSHWLPPGDYILIADGVSYPFTSDGNQGAIVLPVSQVSSATLTGPGTNVPVPGSINCGTGTGGTGTSGTGGTQGQVPPSAPEKTRLNLGSERATEIARTAG